MRKTIAWLVSLIMLSLLSASAAVAEEVTITPPAGPTAIQRGASVTVATPNTMSGYFSTELWGNNTADMDVRALLHGYETVAWARAAGLEVNGTVVKDIQTQQAQDGTIIYTLQFADDLTYNDGTRITAKDYAFYFLLNGAPVIEELGGTTQGLNHIIGYDAYQDGQTNKLSGVRLLAEDTLAISISEDYFPYFYGVVLVSAKPYPLSVMAPGCEIKDDGDGVYISGDFSAAVLEKTLLDPQTGYIFNPQVTCGPYALESYDRASNVATFVVNERYIGNYEGQKPVIERLIFQYTPEEGAVTRLVDGEVDILNKLSDGQAIVQQIDTLTADGQELDVLQASYLRSGFAFLAFSCEESPTDSAAVRRAVAMSFDKDAFLQEKLSEYALRAYGYYGIGQWMVTYSDDGEITGKEPMRSLDALQLLDVPMDLDGAEALLVSDGWTLNAAGEAYDPSTDTVRHKKSVDGTLTPLALKWAVTTDNPVLAGLRAALEASLPSLGIDLQVTEMDFPTLLTHYYRQTDRTYNMFFLASNFGFVFDPYYDFNTAEEYQGMVNTSGLRDERLMDLARDMRETDVGDLRSYVDKWLLFQQRFAELMPMVPLYSNVYVDVFSGKLSGYDIAGNTGWSYAILYAYLAE